VVRTGSVAAPAAHGGADIERSGGLLRIAVASQIPVEVDPVDILRNRMQVGGGIDRERRTGLLRPGRESRDEGDGQDGENPASPDAERTRAG